MNRFYVMLGSFLMLQFYAAGQCPNDVCGYANDLGVVDDVVCFSQCNHDCTDEGQEAECIGQDVDFWYKFELLAPATIAFDLTANYQHPTNAYGDGLQLVLYDGCGGSTLYCESIVQVNPQSFFGSTQTIYEGVYYLQVDGLNPSMGCINMCIASIGVLGIGVQEYKMSGFFTDRKSSIKLEWLGY